MRIEPAPPRRSTLVSVALVGSIVFHAVLLAGFMAVDREKVRESYVVDLVISTPEPALEPTPMPAPTPAPTPAALPPPNKQLNDEPQPAETPKPVFGVTEESITDGDSGVETRVGNTLMKEMEPEFTDPNDVHSYAGPPPGIREATELDRPPKVVRMIEPEYPTLANRAGKEGRVVLRILITRDGRVQQVQVISGPGGNFGFEESAAAAVKQWVFEKPTINGQPVDCWATLPVRFTLDQ